jgi:hypothetical protein
MFGQVDTTLTIPDSIIISAGEYVFINDKLIFFDNDTVLFPGENFSVRFKNKNNYKTDSFYQNLDNKASNKKITRQVYDLLVKDYEKGKTKKDVISTKAFENFEGKQINSIRIKRLDVFGPSQNDTSRQASTWLSDKANNFHVKTLPAIIKNNLLIEEGDEVNAFTLSDNERILRKLPYIKDARFVVTTNASDTNKVDLLIITQDVWSIGIEGNLTGTNTGYFEVFDKNVFGLGHHQNNLIAYNPETIPLYGYEGYYSIPNINGSFINASVFYKHNKNRERYGINIERKFISPEIKYAGGINIARELWYEDYITDTNLNVTPQNQTIEDFWAGRNIKLSENINTSFRKNLFITTRFVNNSFQFKETDAFDSTLKYIDTKMVLMNVGIVNSKYYKGKLISSFGKTEDIPVGAKLNLKTGFHSDETGTRLCLGFGLALATYNVKAGYFRASIDAGTFTHVNELEQSLVKIDINYFTKLFNIFSYQSRQFVKIEYTAGFNRRPYENLSINNANGIRLFRKDDLQGDRKLVISLENVIFTPINFYGFRFAVFGFADFGIIGYENGFISNNDIYSGIGTGVRIRNDNLVFKTLEIKFIYFPLIPDNHNNTFLHIANESGFSFSNFDITAPTITKYE